MTTSTKDCSTHEPRTRLFSEFLNRHDLETAAGLRSGFEEAGYSWAGLSRRSGVAVSTLKSRGDRFGVSLPAGVGHRSTIDENILYDWGDERNGPILSHDHIAEIEAWVDSNFDYLVYEALSTIESGRMTQEMSDGILRAATYSSLLHLVYRTHGMPDWLFWDLEDRLEREERAAAAA